MTLDDAEHYTDEQREEIIAGYPEHERRARTLGLPALGSGLVFPVPEDEIKTSPIRIPEHWPRLNGLDFGWDHPFAAVNLAHDRDADCVYVTKTYRQRAEIPAVHVASVRPWGEWIPCAWPHDGLQHDKGSGLQLAEQYRSHGLNMLAEHATHEEGGFGLEAGIFDMLERMQTGRLKVFSTEDLWFEEMRMYHRKDGKIVKERDDLMSATRIGIMMLREARTRPFKKALKYNNKGII